MNYIEKVKTYELLVNKAMNLSCKTFGKEVETWEEQIASDLFGRICAISFSLLKLIPESEIYKRINAIELWDYSSICILTRTIFDSYLIYYHYCIDIPENESEREFKKLFWDYYIDFKRKKNLDLIKSQYPDLAVIKERNSNELKSIKDNDFFKSLSHGIKRKIENCDIFQIPNNTEIATKAGFEADFYKSTYDYLSRYVHSDSYCIDQIAVFKAGNVEAYRLIGTVLYYLIIILSLSIRDFVKICPEMLNQIDDFIKEIILASEKLAKQIE